MKRCSICGEEKPHSEFHKQSSRADGLSNWCKPCKAVRKRESYLRNRPAALARVAEYRKKNFEIVSEGKKRSRLKKLDQYRARQSAAYWNNRDKALEYSSEYRAANKEKIRARNAAYNAKNRESKNAYQRAYGAANKDERQAYRREWKKRRLKSDHLFWLREMARSRVSLAFRNQGYRKTSKAFEMIGCDFNTLAQHIESGFTEGMGWHNRGEWHMDHKIPLASATTIDELMALCHYTNLQPLWAADNLKKSAKMPDQLAA